MSEASTRTTKTNESPLAFLDLVRQRRSIRKFREERLSPEQIEALKEIALRAPTSRNRKPWEFFFVQDNALLEQLSQAKKSGSAFLNSVALAVVVCAKEESSDAWIEDCSIASIFLQMGAQSMGLGSCWAQIRMREHDDTQSAEAWVQKALSIPSNWRVESIIGIGYPDQERTPVERAELNDTQIHLIDKAD
jgi:nitroreductase